LSTPATSPCQTPVSAVDCDSTPRLPEVAGVAVDGTPAAMRVSGFAPGFQPLKSPITLTSTALGAHTVKRVPPGIGCAPSFS
jgi:hypothetical protein